MGRQGDLEARLRTLHPSERAHLGGLTRRYGRRRVGQALTSRFMRTLGVSVVLMMAPVLGSCGAGATDGKDDANAGPPRLQVAHEACVDQMQDALVEGKVDDEGYSGDSFLSLEADGARLTVRTPEPSGEILSAFALTAATCVLTETGGPTAITQKFGQTTALDGERSDSYDGIDISWTYTAGLNAGGLSAYFVDTEI